MHTAKDKNDLIDAISRHMWAKDLKKKSFFFPFSLSPMFIY
jgi:hypothetical protein